MSIRLTVKLLFRKYNEVSNAAARNNFDLWKVFLLPLTPVPGMKLLVAKKEDGREYEIYIDEKDLQYSLEENELVLVKIGNYHWYRELRALGYLEREAES